MGRIFLADTKTENNTNSFMFISSIGRGDGSTRASFGVDFCPREGILTVMKIKSEAVILCAALKNFSYRHTKAGVQAISVPILALSGN